MFPFWKSWKLSRVGNGMRRVHAMAWIVSHLIRPKGNSSTSNRNKDNINEMVHAFLYVPYPDTGFWLNRREPKFLIIIKTDEPDRIEQGTDNMKKALKIFAIMLCIATLGLALSCSKNKGTATDPIVGNWQCIDGTITYEYSSGETYTYQADRCGYCYAKNGDYYDITELVGKWERIDNDQVGILYNDNSRYDIHEILALSDNVLKRRIIRTREDEANPYTITIIETLKRS